MALVKVFDKSFPIRHSRKWLYFRAIICYDEKPSGEVIEQKPRIGMPMLSE
jgi:hypothetical protein